jgi:hypothetical protein
MREHFGPRGVERRKAITAAGDLLDRQRAAQGFEPPGSQGSLQAVSFDHRVPVTGLGTAPEAMAPAQEATPESSVPAELLFARRRKRGLLAGASAVLLLLVLLGVGLRDRSGADSDDGASKISPAAAPPAFAGTKPPATKPSEVVAARDAGEDSPSESSTKTRDEPNVEAKSDTHKRGLRSSGKHRRSRAVRVRVVPATEEAATKSESQAEPSARPTPPSVVRKPSVDPWDSDIYGGRH